MKRTIVSSLAIALLALFAVPALAGTKTILVKDDFYSPKSTTVSSGSTLRFVWRGDSLHNVVATGPVKFRSSLKRTGSYSKRVTRRGTYTIVCTVHSGMKMKVVVR